MFRFSGPMLPLRLRPVVLLGTVLLAALGLPADKAQALPPVAFYDIQLISPPTLLTEGDLLSVEVGLIGGACSDAWSGILWEADIDYTIEADMNDLGTPTPATLSFSDTNTSIFVNVPTFDDVDPETDEIFELVISAGSMTSINCPTLGGTIEPNLTEYRFQFMITDNDVAMPHINVLPESVSEQDGLMIFDVMLLDPPPGQTVSVEVFTEDNTAIAGDDYNAVSVTQLDFMPGITSIPVAVTILDDSEPEGIEEFFLKLQNPVGATLDVTFVDGEINDNDPFLLAIKDADIIETDPGDNPNIMVPVELAPAAPFMVTVDWQTANGSAIAGQDYNTSGGTVTFMPGETMKMVAVPILGDSDEEGDEFFFIDISNAMGAQIDDAQAKVTIFDNDFGGPQFTVLNAPDAVEGGGQNPGQLVFTVELNSIGQKATKGSKGAIGVDYTTLDETAIAGQDYIAKSGTLTFVSLDTAQQVIVDLIGDDVPESTEKLTLMLKNPVGATIAVDEAFGQILDDDAPQNTPVATIDDVSLDEGDEGTTEAVFTISLTAPAPGSIQLSYTTTDDGAVAGEDYQARSGTVVFAEGQSMRPVRIPVIGDTLPEEDESFRVLLSSPVGLVIGDGEGVGTIVNDDEPPAPQLSVEDAEIAEGDSNEQDMLFAVRLDPAADVEVTVDYATADGTARGGIDYRAASGTLTFAAGETQKTVAVRIVGDTAQEGDETFTVTLAEPVGAEIADGEATGTIIDDDALPPPLPEISIDDVSVLEGDEGTTLAVFTVSVAQRTKNVVQIDFQTVDGTALAADQDYVAASGRLILESGQLEGTIEIAVVGDTRVEDDERFAVRLTSPQGAVLGRSTGFATIVNDDEDGGGGGGGGGGGTPSTVRLLPAGAVTEGAGPAIVTIERLGNTSGAATAVVQTSSGSAVSGQDFQATSQQVAWAAGESGPRQVSIAILDDNIVEGDESFSVAISQAQGAVVGVPGQVGVQILDEDTPMRLEAVGDQELEGAVRGEVQLAVRVLREDGSPVEGALVRWQAEGKAAVAGEGEGRSDAEGAARQRVLLARTPGLAQVVARLAGTEATVSFAITVRGDLMGSLGDGADRNENGVADVLDRSCADGGGQLEQLCEYIYGIDDPDQRRQALERLTPKGALARNRAAIQGPKTQVRNVSARMQALRAGGARTVAQLTMNFRDDSLSLGPLQEAIAGYLDGATSSERQKVAAQLAKAVDAGVADSALLADEDAAGPAAASDADDGLGDSFDPYDSTESPWGFFLNGRASFGDAPRRGVEPSYDFETDGLSMGVDYRVSSRFVVGAALGYLSSDTDISGDRGSIDMEGYSLTLYGTYFKDAFYLEGALTYGVSEYDIERVIELPIVFQGRGRLVAAGSPDSDQLAVTAAAGYDFRLGRAATLSGFIRGSYIESNVDPYTEAGAFAFNIAYSDQQIESLLGEAGVELLYPFSFSWGVLQPMVRVAFLHEFEDGIDIVRARFAGDPMARTFTLVSERPDRDFMNVAAGVTATLQRGWAGYFQYDTDLERDDLDIYTLTGGVRFQF